MAIVQMIFRRLLSTTSVQGIKQTKGTVSKKKSGMNMSSTDIIAHFKRPEKLKTFPDLKWIQKDKKFP